MAWKRGKGNKTMKCTKVQLLKQVQIHKDWLNYGKIEKICTN